MKKIGLLIVFALALFLMSCNKSEELIPSKDGIDNTTTQNQAASSLSLSPSFGADINGISSVDYVPPTMAWLLGNGTWRMDSSLFFRDEIWHPINVAPWIYQFTLTNSSSGNLSLFIDSELVGFNLWKIEDSLLIIGEGYNREDTLHIELINNTKVVYYYWCPADVPVGYIWSKDILVHP